MKKKLILLAGLLAMAILISPPHEQAKADDWVAVSGVFIVNPGGQVIETYTAPLPPHTDPLSSRILEITIDLAGDVSGVAKLHLIQEKHVGLFHTPHTEGFGTLAAQPGALVSAGARAIVRVSWDVVPESNPTRFEGVMDIRFDNWRILGELTAIGNQGTWSGRAHPVY